MSKQKKQVRREDRHVRLYHWLMRSPAWKGLPPVARALYAELAKHYNGSNNGKIGYSVRQAAEDLRISKDTAGQYFRVLQARGFIDPVRRGAFSRKMRHATEWRMTEFTCDASGMAPTKDFMRWEVTQDLEHGTATGTDGPNNRTDTVRLQGPTISAPPSTVRLQGPSTAPTVRLEGHSYTVNQCTPDGEHHVLVPFPLKTA
jgi:hypothetical protein